MPPDAGPWIAFAALLSSAAMVFSFVRAWRRRIDVAERIAERDRNTPLSDPFVAVLRTDDQARPGAAALTMPALELDIHILWSLAVAGTVDVQLYMESGAQGRCVAICQRTMPASTSAVSAAEAGLETAALETVALDSAEQMFGFRPDAAVRGNYLYVHVPGTDVPSSFEQLSVAACALELASFLLPPALRAPPATLAVPATCSWFADGWEFGALPPFARISRDEQGRLVARAKSKLSYRKSARPRFAFVSAQLVLTPDILQSAATAPPGDPLASVPQLRVIGGDVAAVRALGSRDSPK